MTKQSLESGSTVAAIKKENQGILERLRDQLAPNCGIRSLNDAVEYMQFTVKATNPQKTNMRCTLGRPMSDLCLHMDIAYFKETMQAKVASTKKISVAAIDEAAKTGDFNPVYVLFCPSDFFVFPLVFIYSFSSTKGFLVLLFAYR